MFKPREYEREISLIPGGCPQILDFEAPFASLDKLKYSFEELKVTDGGSKKVQLHVYKRTEEGEYEDELAPGQFARGYGYELNLEKTLKPWLGEWLPVPFLRMREQNWTDSDEPRFEYGPTNWARARLVQDLDHPDMLRLVLAFDMRVEEKNGETYAALCQEDVDANAHFRLAWRFRDNAWFMDLLWVEEWLREAWTQWHKKNHARMNEERQFEYLASYLVYLGVIRNIIDNRQVYVIRPDGKICIDVDLVLDIGNSRSTGILVESQSQSATNLNNSYLLQLRDLSEPEKVYVDPFETRVEFSEASFGNDALSMRSGRYSPAFVWPSPVRIGPEAARLATLSRCEQGSTGMSSPKRYLWDERNWERTWRFNTGTEKAPFVTRGPLAQIINSSGTPLCCMDDKLFKSNKLLRQQEEESAFESLFTRSSLMMFLLVEIIQQALLTINSPATRYASKNSSSVPRRLRQIIFTVPAGMPVAEQKIYRRWAKWAVRVLWEALGWSEYYSPERKRLTGEKFYDYRESPIVRCEWDEATCTQLVFIYNEITRKFQGDARLFCEVMGRPRDVADHKDVPSIRIATIDIGGGTTDLSITTFELSSASGATPRMSPHPEFHDGFNLAGDDILREVLKEQFLPALGAYLGEIGVRDTRRALASLFGRDTMDASKDTLNQRIQFIRQIGVPVSLVLLKLYEETDLKKGSGAIRFRVGDCFEQPEQPAPEAENGEEDQENSQKTALGEYIMPGPAALSYIPNYLVKQGIDTDFDIMNMAVTMDPAAMEETVMGALRKVLLNLCEVISMYNCDALLLTGRPSRWPGIVHLIYSLLPVPPGRIFPMAEYNVGPWYPFADALGNITDPKTTVVVGAILCALAEGQLEGFSFDPHTLSLKSTARFIGEMERTGQIKKDKVWFTVNPETGVVAPPKKDVVFAGPMSVGFRQLEAERWTTTRFYFLEWSGESALNAYKDNLPFTVTLALTLPEKEVDEKTVFDECEFNDEEMEITGRNGQSIPKSVLTMRLQTLPATEGFWMDTGIIYES